MEFLPAPEVIRCFFDTSMAPHLPAMELCWHADAPGSAERFWHLPRAVTIHGAAPTRFGVTVERTGDNSYTLRLLWNELALAWSDLTRTQIMTSSLSVILQALDTDLWHLLDQPMQPALAA